MLTAVFEAPREQVEHYARNHLSDPQLQAVGRLTAVQAPELERLGEQGIRELAEAYNLPLRGVVDKPAFSSPVRFLALPPAKVTCSG